MSDLPKTRRVVTGHDENSLAIVVSDAVLEQHHAPAAHMASTHVWATGGSPADIFKQDDGRSSLLGTCPAANGTRIGVLDIAPGGEHAAPHRTDTIDYVICVCGEIEMRLDRSAVVLRPGDILVQRGTNHSWANAGKTPARLVYVLLDGEPKREGSLTGAQLAR